MKPLTDWQQEELTEWEQIQRFIERTENSLGMKLLKALVAFTYISMFGAWFMWLIAGLLPF